MKRVTELFRQNSAWEITGKHTFYNRVYEVDANGCFYRYGKLVKVKPDKANSLQVQLIDDDNKPVRFKIHQIVGQTFFKDKFKTLNTIDHINRDRLNNSVNNLRVADRKTQYANRDNKSSKEKRVLCLNNNNVYDSCKHAEIDLNLVKNTVCRVARGERKWIHGYTFKFI